MWRQCVDTLRSALKDNTTGLVPMCAVAADALGIDRARIRTDFHYEPWLLSGQPSPTGQPNLAVEPRRQRASLQIPPDTAPRRDAEVALVVGYEFFYSEGDVIEDNISVVSAALILVLDTLREYSDAHGGTIVQVADPVDIDIGPYLGTPVAGGFQASITIYERGTL